MTPSPRLTRLRTHLKTGSRYYLAGLYSELTQKDVFLWAQAIAFKVLITIVPVIVLATGVLGQVLQRKQASAAVARFSGEFLPLEYGGAIVRALQELESASSTFTLVGVIGLLLSAITLFTTLRIAVGNVFQEEWHVQRSIVRGYAFDLRMVVQVGLLFILTLGLTFAVQALNAQGVWLLERIGLDYAWLTTGWQRAIRTLGLLIPFLLTTTMFFQLLYFVPKPHPPKRSAFIGALVTSVLWETAKSGFAFYATNVGHFDRYEAAGGDGFIEGLGQTFGLILAFVFWVYLSGLLLCGGALVALLHEKRLRQKHPERFRTREEEAAEEAAAEGTVARKREGLQRDVLPDLPADPEPVGAEAGPPARNGAPSDARPTLP